ncbi:MAG: nucleotidyltransferase domain-containing protein [Acidimicrobiaceae bacterium]|nr:nucleotidyltransferase domain-containing protein [Acidimicrobiaceae bacterium]MDE0607557.1 nucleotidyltransferase domain-containing protein [Acidimicrobiaceae bacterium]
MADELDLRSPYRQQIEELLSRHLPGVEVWAYGSRVKGESHDTSDLDLVLRGPGLQEISAERIFDLKDALTESNIPILVEVFDWSTLPDSFHREIEKRYVAICSDGDL